MPEQFLPSGVDIGYAAVSIRPVNDIRGVVAEAPESFFAFFEFFMGAGIVDAYS